MNTETIAAIQKALAPVAEKIGQGAQYGWDVVLAQQKVTAIGDFIFAAAAVVVMLICAWWALACWKKHVDDRHGDWIIGVVMLTTVCFACFALMGLALYDGSAHLINPSYYALKFFVGLAGGNVSDF